MSRVTRDPMIQGGAPCIAGTRINVSAVKSFHEAGYTAEAIMREYPDLTSDDIAAAIAYDRFRLRRFVVRHFGCLCAGAAAAVGFVLYTFGLHAWAVCLVSVAAIWIGDAWDVETSKVSEAA